MAACSWRLHCGGHGQTEKKAGWWSDSKPNRNSLAFTRLLSTSLLVDWLLYGTDLLALDIGSVLCDSVGTLSNDRFLETFFLLHRRSHLIVGSPPSIPITLAAMSRQRLAAVVFLVLFAFSASQRAFALSEDEVSACLDIARAIPGLASITPTPWTAPNLASTCNGSSPATGLTCYDSILTSLTIDASLSGSWPAALSKLTTLGSVAIYAPLTGTLPTEWSALALSTSMSSTPSLELNLSSTSSGSLPESWSNITGLKTLTLTFSKTSTTSISLPSWVGKIETVNVTNGKIDGFSTFTPALPNPQSGLDYIMENLYLTNVKLGATFPPGLTTMTYLRNLIIKNDPENVNFFGSASTSLPADISKMFLCTSISLVNVAFGGSLPSSYAGCRTYEFSGMPNLVGTIPSSLFNTMLVSTVTLHDLPKVKGSLPSPTQSIFNQVSTIDINNVGLDGTISPQLFSVRSFETLSLVNLPKLKGSLPESTSSCGLRRLSVSSLTSLTGSIPESLFANCSSLAMATIENTRITGTLPQSLAGVDFIKLVISNNPMSGTIPNITMSTYSSGLYLSLRNSGFSGTIPMSLASSYGSFSYIDLSRNRLDLCANNGTSGQDSLKERFNGVPTCDIGTQNPEECGCSSAWPTSCFPDETMSDACTPTTGNSPYSWETEFPPPPPLYNSPYYNSAPVAPTAPSVPSAPSSSPSGANGPTGNAPALQQNFCTTFICALLLILFVMN